MRILDYTGGSNVITGSFQEVRAEQATQLPRQRPEGYRAKARNAAAIEAGKSKEIESTPQPPKGAQPSILGP